MERDASRTTRADLRPALLACAVLVAMPSNPTAAQNAPAAEIVTTSFAWPVGTSATVVTYSRNMRSGGQVDSDIVIEGSYDFDVDAHADGILVRHSNFLTTSFTSVPELPEDNPLQLLYTRLGSVTPNYVVSPEGDLLRVEGVEEMRDRTREVLAPILDSIPEQGAALESLLNQITSTDYLFSQLVEQWNLMVGFWVGAELELEALYEFEDQAPSPLMPQELIPFLYQFGASERVPCTEASDSPSCVLFEFWSRPDPEVIGDVLRRWMEQLAPDIDGGIESLDQETFVSLVADPATLLPYSWEMSQVVTVVGTENGERTEEVRSDETVLEFRYR